MLQMKLSIINRFMCKKILVIILSFAPFLLSAQIGIGTKNVSSNTILEIYSPNRGILLPKTTTTEMNSINDPSLSLLFFNSTINTLVIYDSALTQSWSVLNPWVLAADNSGSIYLRSGFKLGLGRTPASDEILAVAGTMKVNGLTVTNTAVSLGNMKVTGELSAVEEINISGNMSSPNYDGFGFFPRGTILIWDYESYKTIPAGWVVVSMNRIYDPSPSSGDNMLDPGLCDVALGYSSKTPSDSSNVVVPNSGGNQSIKTLESGSTKASETRYKYVYILKTF